MKEAKPDTNIKELVHEMCRSYAGTLDDEFKRFLEEIYISERGKLEKSEEKEQQYRVLSIPASGLLAFGDLEMVDVILKSIPPPPQESPESLIYRLGSIALQSLLPIPENINVRIEVSKVKIWFEGNKEHLRWDETLGKFILI